MKTFKAGCLKCVASKCVLSFILIYLKCVMTLDVMPQKEKFLPDYTVYHNLTSISYTVDKLVNENQDFIRTEKKYISKEGRYQYLLHMTNFTNHDKHFEKVKIFLSYGEHAREFLPIDSCLCLINYLLQNDKNSLIKTFSNNFLNLIDLYILVIGNPDGRHLVETRSNYCWRGTKTGVDINRNMDWEFGGKGSSSVKTDEEYKGKNPFSEPESIVYRDLPKVVKFDAFLSLHSGIKQIYIPYADSKSRKTRREPDNLAEMMSLAKLMSTATLYRYEYGKATTLNAYDADGTVFDYMAGVHKIPFSYAIELWGPISHKGPTCFDLFNPPNQRLKSVIENLLPLYTTLFDYLIKWKKSKNLPTRGKSEPSVPEPSNRELVDAERGVSVSDVPSLTPGYTLLVVVVIVTILIGLHGRYPIFRRFYQRRRIISLRSLSSSFSANMFSP